MAVTGGSPSMQIMMIFQGFNFIIGDVFLKNITNNLLSRTFLPPTYYSILMFAIN